MLYNLVWFNYSVLSHKHNKVKISLVKPTVFQNIFYNFYSSVFCLKIILQMEEYMLLAFDKVLSFRTI